MTHLFPLITLPICLVAALLIGARAVVEGWQSGRAYAVLNRLLATSAAHERLASFERAGGSGDLNSNALTAATTAFAHSLEDPTYSTQLAYGAGVLSLVNGDLAAARSTLLAAGPKHGPVAGYQLGLAMYRAGDTRGAAEAWRSSDTVELMRARAHATLAAGRRDEAAGLLHVLAELQPDSSRSWLDLGELGLNQQDWNAALTAYGHVLELEPGNLDAEYMIGYTLYYGLHDPSRARASMQVILDSGSATDAQMSNVCVLMARMAVADGRTDEGLAWYDRALGLRGALRLFPLRERAAVYQSLGQPDLAIASLLDALREVPADTPTLLELGRFLVADGRPADAAAYLQRAVSLSPNDLEARTALADAVLRSAQK